MLVNGYYRIEDSIENIRKKQIRFDSNRIIDLEIPEENPNVLVYGIYNDERETENYINIYSSVRIMITNESAIKEDGYEELGVNIEYIIVDEEVIRNKKENMVRFMSRKRAKEYIREECINKGRYDYINENGESYIYLSCYLGLKELSLEILERVEDRIINSNMKERNILDIICKRSNMEEVYFRVIDRLDEETINNVNRDETTALYWSIAYIRSNDIAKSLIERMTEENINRRNIYGESIIYVAAKNEMNEEVMMELLKRTRKEVIDSENLNESVLYELIINGMEDVAIEVYRRMEKIRKKREMIIRIARNNDMEKLEKEVRKK
jgi:hypothetical protein